MTTRSRLAALVVIAWSAVAPVGADVVLPARLEVAEVETGRYEVVFTLPLLEGRVLRAQPVFPPTCRDATEWARAASGVGVTSTWSVACEPASLAGEAITVEGLLGTQIEIAFNLTTLDGRTFSEILRPSRPGFLVPPPPTPWELATGVGAAGLRWVLKSVEMWLLALVVGLAGVRARDQGLGVAAFGAGSAVAVSLVDMGWFAVSPPVAEAFVLITVAVPAVAVAGGSERWRGWIRPLWPASLLGGVLLAGATNEAVVVDGLSRAEQVASFSFFAAGAAGGLGWLLLIAAVLRSLLATGSAGEGLGGAARLLGTTLGAVAVGMLMVRAMAVAAVAGEIPPAALSLLGAAVAVAPLLGCGGAGGLRALAVFAAAAGLALIPGLARIPLPAGEAVVPGVLLGVGLALCSARRMQRAPAAVLAAAAVVVSSWWGTQAMVDNLSRSTGLAVGLVVCAAAVCFIVSTLCVQWGSDAASRAARVVGLGVTALMCAAGAAAAWRWVEGDAAISAALGLVPLPMLSMALIGLAVALWPRRRRVLDELGVDQRRPVGHWAALGAALLAIPYGTMAVGNPLHEPAAPSGDDAGRVVSAVLFDTYRAFNLTDEDEVFDRLTDSVTGDLVENLYLDSRRRLNAGTREGTEVTVRDVAVLEIGEPVEAAVGTGAFAYRCRWVVTSRVRHLQHIHHRQNVYGGVLSLVAEGDRWKIAGIDLTSEDRVVIPGPAT
ncbi:MAG: hypothetical protein V2I67_18435 [Thermoanaerobaculales bacterium]|jgi:hypothetical protein|nr:hypothetical protein [Thermoanaerobaculales bacterium]